MAMDFVRTKVKSGENLSSLDGKYVMETVPASGPTQYELVDESDMKDAKTFRHELNMPQDYRIKEVNFYMIRVDLDSDQEFRLKKIDLSQVVTGGKSIEMKA